MKRLLILAMILLPCLANAQGNKLAMTPPMGWASWNKFGCEVSDQIIRAQADAMASNGMREAGYTYINIDDCWQGTRDANGVLQPNQKFPDMKALAGYVHSKGLKLGMYTSPGPKTCARFEGSYQHEEQDAKMFADWGVDYLKYDWCSASQVYKLEQMPEVYKKMSDALKATGRPIVYSLCQYGWNEVWKWGAAAGGNLWRTTGDIEPSFFSMVYIGMNQSGLEQYAGPGHWNDPDMLEVGNGRFSQSENRYHMSLWAMLSAPLIAGNDLTQMKPEVLEVLTNKDVIAIDQDALGKQARRIRQIGPLSIWVKEMSDGSRVVGFFSINGQPTKGSIDLKEIGMGKRARIQDIWEKKDLGVVESTFSTAVPARGVTLVRITKAK